MQRAAVFRPSAACAAALVAAGSLGLLACREPAEPPPPTGRALYVQYCASCHGLSGTGDGPVAGSLLRAPSDLTRLAARAGGRFDEASVMAVIDGRRKVAEHGPREMPVWGAVFEEELEQERWGSWVTLLHARALTDYVRSIQED